MYNCICYNQPQLDNASGKCTQACPDGINGATCGYSGGDFTMVSIYPVSGSSDCKFSI